MAVDPALLAKAEEIRDETQVGANTAARVGGLFVDLVNKFGLTDDDIKAISDYLEDYNAVLSNNDDDIIVPNKAYAINLHQSRLVLLDSMGLTYDGEAYTIQDGDVYYDSGYIKVKSGGSAPGAVVKKGVLYINKITGKFYEWNGATFVEIAVSGSGGGADFDTLKAKIQQVQDNVERLFNNLANMAFWDAAAKLSATPIPLDWSVPKKTVTITNNLANSVITHNGSPVSGSVQVDEGATLTLLVSAAPGYILKSVLVDNVAATDNGDGTFTITKTNVTSNVTIVITGTYAESVNVSFVNADGYLELSPLAVVSGEDYSGTLAIKSSAPNNCELPSTISATIGGVAVDFTASGNSYDPSDGSITIANVTGALVITAVANVPLDFTLLLLYLTNYTGVISRPFNDKRATVLLEVDKVAHPSDWHATSDATCAQLQTEYSLIPIPAGATSVQMTCNSGFQLVAYVYPDNLTGATDPGWQGQSYTIDLTQYSSPAYIGVNFKKDPEANFTNETLADIGFTLEFS